jgi:uncharacterized protein
MKIEVINQVFSICKVNDVSHIRWQDEFCFIGKTDEELSLVCETTSVPSDALERDDHWQAFRIQGILDFSQIGVLAKISTVLAEDNISIFALSTYNTDYILTKKDDFPRAIAALQSNGYQIVWLNQEAS